MSRFFEEKELLEKRASIHSTMKDMVAEAEKEGRGFNAEEQVRFDKLDKDFESYSSQIEQVRKLNKREAELAEKVEEEAEKRDISTDEVIDSEKRYDQAFNKYLRNENLNSEDRSILAEKRAQSTTNSAGGYTIPEGFSNQLEVALLAYGGMMQAADVIYTDSGNDLPWPTSNDTTNAGVILGENTQVAEQDITFSSVTLGAYKYSSKLIRASEEILQDSAFDLNGFIANALATRIGRIWNTHFTTGSGTSQPNGVVTASGNAVNAASASAIAFGDFINLEHAVDPAYRIRSNAKCGYMFSDATLKEIKSLTVGSSDARPLWQPSYSVGEPDTVNGWRYWINQDLDDANTGGNRPVLFGDFSKYKIRIVKGFTLKRLVERYADYHQVGFLGFARADGNLIDAGTNPVAYLRHATT